jgi:uncharacterized protein YbjT (DUF2867 family)
LLHELITGPTERILLVSYAAYTLAELAADLDAAVDRARKSTPCSRSRRTVRCL